MAITIVGTASNKAQNDNVTVTFPGGVQEDDIVIVEGIANRNDDPSVVTSGYTSIISERDGNYRHHSWRKVMGASPDGSVEVEGSGGSFSGAVWNVRIYRGVDTSTPMDASATKTDGSSTGADGPAITTVTDGAWVISSVALKGTVDGTATEPSGYGNKIDDAQTTVSSYSADKEVSTAGSEDPGAWSHDFASWSVFSIALRPAATADALTSQDITSGSPTIDAPDLGQEHALTSQDVLSGTPTIDQATLGVVHPLTAQDVLSGAPTIDAASLGQEHALTSQDITSGTPTIDQASPSEVVALTAQDVTAGTPTVDQATIAQVHALTVEDVIAGAPVIDAPVLGSEAEAQPGGGSSRRGRDQGPIKYWWQFQSLTAQNVTAGAPRITAPTLTEVARSVEDHATWGGLDFAPVVQENAGAERDKVQADDLSGVPPDFARAAVPAPVRERELAAVAERREQVSRQAPSRDADHRQRILRDEEEFLSLFMRVMD